MDRILVETKPTAEGVALLHITIRTRGWPIATALLEVATLGMLWYMVWSGIHLAIFETLAVLFIFMRALTTFTQQTVLIDGPAFSIYDRIFGIKVRTQKFFFKGASNLRYEP